MKKFNAHPFAYYFGVLRNILWTFIFLLIFSLLYEKNITESFIIIVGVILFVITFKSSCVVRWLLYKITNTAFIQCLFYGVKIAFKVDEAMNFIKGERYYMLTGNTYEFKESIKKFGGKWIPSEKSWKISGYSLKEFLKYNKGKITRVYVDTKKNIVKIF